MTLVPAYGRDYTSKRAVLKDWNANLDFIICDLFSPYDGKPVNRADLERGLDLMPFGGQVQIRYKRLNRIAVVQV